MALNESNREDLMAEAVALVRRVEFNLPGQLPAIIIGFRQTGWLSVYFGPNSMLQFDAVGRLRRAFSDGFLYRTQGTTLAKMHRNRTEHETVLVRQDLDVLELHDFRHVVLSRILWLSEQLASGSLNVVEQIPEADDLLMADIGRFLESVLNSTEFLAPAIKGKP